MAVKIWIWILALVLAIPTYGISIIVIVAIELFIRKDIINMALSDNIDSNINFWIEEYVASGLGVIRLENDHRVAVFEHEIRNLDTIKFANAIKYALPKVMAVCEEIDIVHHTMKILHEYVNAWGKEGYGFKHEDKPLNYKYLKLVTIYVLNKYSNL